MIKAGTAVRFVSAAVSMSAVLASLWNGAADAQAAQTTVVELFTSQSCYSCPPAEKLLGDLAGRGDVIALEHHVDYWDKLVYGAAGRWQDVFSSPEATQRQRAYNLALRGEGSVYTPQMVFDGWHEVVGNRRDAVLKSLAKAGRDRDKIPPVGVGVSARAGGGFDIAVVADAGRTADIWIVRFLNAHTTRVRAGENKGKTLSGRNIVREIRHVGVWTGKAAAFSLADFQLDDGYGCAVLLQAADAGPIIGAARCPAPVS